MALVITLILISVITFLAVAFLMVSRRDSAAIGLQTDQTIARLAADAGAEHAKSMIMNNMRSHRNKYENNFFVSTNFINRNGFVPKQAIDYFNVSYFKSDGTQFEPVQFEEMLNNLYYDARPPVFVKTNSMTGKGEFRYFLNWNRNTNIFGQAWFEDTGWLVECDNGGNPILDQSQIPAAQIINYHVGDPQWIGILERPDLPHSSSNRFTGRFCYVVIPAGKTLDVNYIHNQTQNPQFDIQSGSLATGFFRNQGAGNSEINLAGVLADANTNLWNRINGDGSKNYQYQTPTKLLLGSSPMQPSVQPYAFLDALAILTNRYLGIYGSQAAPFNLLPFMSDPIDRYSDGPPTFALPSTSRVLVMPTKTLPVQTIVPTSDTNTFLWRFFSWSGSPNTNHYLSPQEYFNMGKTPGFAQRLIDGSSGTNFSTYNRHTFYRLLNALGMESSPDREDKININYKNTQGYRPEDFKPWQPVDLFTNIATRLLTDTRLCPVGDIITNLSSCYIPVFWTNASTGFKTNFYAPSVHRLLQVAANIVDATTNRTQVNGLTVSSNFPPSVFRPIFRRDTAGEVVWIAGYLEETNTDFLSLPKTMYKNLDDPVSRMEIPVAGAALQPTSQEPMAIGVPLVIGAKKGFPNLNKIDWQVFVMVARKLELLRTATSERPHMTNQLFEIGISNAVALQAWNSYSGAYPRDLGVYAEVVQTKGVLSNALAVPVVSQDVLLRAFNAQTPASGHTYAAGTWNGYNANFVSSSFTIPVQGGAAFVPWSALRIDSGGHGLILSTNVAYRNPPTRTGFPAPDFKYYGRARVLYYVWDKALNRIVDYVNMDNLEMTIDIQNDLTGYPDTAGNYSTAGELWRTNRLNGGAAPMAPTLGVIRQLEMSKTYDKYASEWSQHNWYQVPDAQLASAQFLAFLGEGSAADNLMITNMQTPFCPVRAFYKKYQWEANDPLVHYMSGDMFNDWAAAAPVYRSFLSLTASTNVMPGLLLISTRYQPWPAKVSDTNANTDPKAYALMLKDPGIKKSDNWDFPTNRFASIGWLGRVHRGTPWQTIYLKPEWFDAGQGSANLNRDLRTNWTGIWSSWTGNPTRWDARYTMPTNDWALLEHFSTASTAESSQGQLNINNDELAAWSGVLSGVLVVSNSASDRDVQLLTSLVPTFDAYVIDPAGADLTGLNSKLRRIYNGIMFTRTNAMDIVTQTGATSETNHWTAFPAKSFQQLGDILAVPELTVASPFLNLSLFQRQRTVTDAVYEWIPQQILSLLRCNDDPRFVVFSYGQTLKPADNSQVMSGAYLGLVTNYQITAETATRTVFRVEHAPSAVARTNSPPPRVVVESYMEMPVD